MCITPGSKNYIINYVNLLDAVERGGGWKKKFKKNLLNAKIVEKQGLNSMRENCRRGGEYSSNMQRAAVWNQEIDETIRFVIGM